MQARTARLIDKLFHLALFVKGVDGLLDLVGGLTLLFVTPQAISNFAAAITAHELSQDPNDFVSTHILNAANSLVGFKTFAALYLCLHGLAKILLILGLLKDQLWAYPVAIGFISLFILYQSYRVGFDHSLPLAILTLFDIVFVALVRFEWRRHHARLHPGPFPAQSLY